MWGGRRSRASTFNILLFLLFIALPASANDLQVDKRTLSADDTVTITITLTNAFASVDNIQLPLQNLVLDGSPSVSSEFAWINGNSSRRKILSYHAHPAGPGPALIGPVTLHGSEGQTDTLAPLSIQVLPDLAAGSNDPERVLHELLATNRDPIFVVAEANKTSVFAGEQVIVTWTLYNAANVQQEGIGQVPKLADFWVEELDVRGETPQQVLVGGLSMQRLVIRRAALFPLHSGTVTVEPMAVEAQIMKRLDIGNPFGLFEGSVVDVHRRSSAIAIEARPIPPGPPVAAVGSVSLQCHAPVQRNGGPVSIDVVMRGTANLRAASPPAFVTPIEGSVQIADVNLKVERSAEAVMERRWRFLVFPASAGMFVIPPMTTTVLTPVGERRELRCEQRSLMVEAAEANAVQPKVPSTPSDKRVEAMRRSLPLIGIAAALLALLGLVWPRLARAARNRRDTRALMRETPVETRVAVEEWLSARAIDAAALLHEASERGDAWRALRSLLDAAERDRLVAEPEEVRGRIRDLVASV